MSTDPTELSADFGRRLAAARMAAGLSQRQLARAIGHEGPDAVSRYERGLREPRLSALVALASALKVPVASLLPGAEHRAENPQSAAEFALTERLRNAAKWEPRAAAAAVAAASAVLSAFDSR